MKQQRQISDDLRAALNIAIPLASTKITDLNPSQQAAIKLLIQYRAAETGLDERFFIRPDFSWRESSLKNEPYEDKLNDFLTEVIPKLSSEVLDRTCYENPFRPRLTVDMTSSAEYKSYSEIKLKIKINNQALSKQQLKDQLDDYQRRNIPIIIDVPAHVAAKIEKAVLADYQRSHHNPGEILIGPPQPVTEINIPTSSATDSGDLLCDIDTFWDFSNELLENHRAVIPENGYYRSIFKPGYRKEWRENLARNALIDHSIYLADKLSKALDTIEVASTFYNHYQTDGFCQASWESFKTLSTILADRKFYDLFQLALTELTGKAIPGPIYVLLWYNASIANLATLAKDAFTSQPPSLPWTKTQSVTTDLKDFYSQLCIPEKSGNIPTYFPEIQLKNHSAPKNRPHQHAWYREKKQSGVEIQKLEQKIQIRFIKPNYADYQHNRYQPDYPVPECVISSPLAEHRITLKNWQASYSFPVGDYNISLLIDLPSLAYFLWRQYKYWRMSPAKKIGIELLSSAELYCNDPSREHQHLLETTLHDYLNLNPQNINLVKKIRYAAATKNIKGMRALISNDFEGRMILDQTYRNHYIRLQNNDPGNIPELLNTFKDEPGRYAYIAGLYLDPNNYSPALAKKYILRAIAGLPPDKNSLIPISHENILHDSLLGLAKTSDSEFKTLQEFHARMQTSKPDDKSLLRREIDDYLQLNKVELALAVSKKISPYLQAEDTYKEGLILLKLNKSVEALSAFQNAVTQEGKAVYSTALLDSLLKKQNDLAYHAATQIRDLYLELRHVKEAGIIAEIICNNPCEVNDFRIMGDIYFQQGDKEAAIGAYMKYVSNVKVISVELKEVLLRLGEHFKSTAPGTALSFFYDYLIIDPDVLVIYQCEEIFIQHNDYLQLRNFYLSLENNNYAMGKLEKLDQFINQSTQLRFADGVLSLIQMATPLAMHYWDENATVIKLLRGAQIGVDTIQKFLLPHYAAKIKPAWIKRSEPKPTPSQKNISHLSTLLGGMSAMVQFSKLYQNSIGSTQHDEILAKASTALEGTSLMVDSAQTIYPFVSEIKGWNGLTEAVTQFSLKQSWDTALHLGENIYKTVSESGWQVALETYGESALAAASIISLGMRIYEYKLQTTGQPLPDSSLYYGLKNFLGYTSASVLVASKMGLTTAGAVAGAKAGVAGVGWGFSWVASSVAAGGSQAALGAVCGASGVGLAALGLYGGYKGVQFIHNATTVQHKASAMEYNLKIGELEKKGEFSEIIQGLEKIDKLTGKLKNKTKIAYYQCQQFLKEKRFAEAEKLSGELLQNESIELPIKSNLKNIRLIAFAGLSVDTPVDIDIPLSLYRELIQTAAAEQKEYSTQIVQNILDNHFNQWQMRTGADSKPENWQQGLTILQKIVEINPDPNNQQRVDLYLCNRHLEEKNYEELTKLQQKLASQQLDQQKQIFLKKIQLNAALQLAAEGKPFDHYRPMQDYKDIIAVTDEKEKDQWTKKVISILQVDMIRSAKSGEFSKAAEFAAQAYQLEELTIHQHHKNFYQIAHLFQQKQYSQAEQLSAQLLANREQMNDELLANILSLKLNVAAAGVESKELKPDMDKLWGEFQEWSTLQSQNSEAKLESSSQKQIIMFLLRKSAQQEAQEGRFDKAQLQCQRMLTIRPKDAEIIHQYRVYEYQMELEKKDFTKLLEKCHTELAFNAKDELALKYEGLAYLNKQKFRDSMRSFEQLANINSHEPEPFIYLSEVASAMQNFDKAQSYLRKAIALIQTKQKQYSTQCPEEKSNPYTKQLEELNKFDQNIQDKRSQIIRSSMGETSGKILGHCISLGLSLWMRPLSSSLPVGQKLGSYSRISHTS